MTNRTYIGIDPGVKTGYALWRDDTLHVSTTTFWAMAGTLEQFANIHEPETVTVVIEDPNLNRPVWFNGKGANNHATALKVAQSVGSNKRDAQLLIELAESLGFDVCRIRPTKQKWNRQTFERITGYTSRTSEHGRDAARLIVGRSNNFPRQER